MSNPAETAFDASTFLATCTRQPGVYRMLDGDGAVLYVGKARNLQARLRSYFGSKKASVKTRAMVARIAAVEVTVTASETEALLLEQSLIKALRPPYNILMRDDKSYPYIRISTRAPFPRLSRHRGARRTGDLFFGPYPSAVSVRETISLVEKIFQLRTCTDSNFRNRSRPCLQHQIGRCTAPCVGLVSKQDYDRQVQMATDFLAGRSDELIGRLAQAMQQAADELAFERAAVLRDQISAVQSVREKQYVDTGTGNADAIALASDHGDCIIDVLKVRDGRLLGHESHYPAVNGDNTAEDILEAFLSHYYLQYASAAMLPGDVILDRPVSGLGVLSDALRQATGRRVRFVSSVRKERLAWQKMAMANARHGLASRQNDLATLTARRMALAELLGLEAPPRRIECFDISHTAGEKAVASCVVLTETGESRGEYRRFNVSPRVAGDDYAAIAEAVRRRYQRVVAESLPLPDILLIDGGKGQTAGAREVIRELGLEARLQVMGISKGPSRRPGIEQLHVAADRVLTPAADHPGFQLLQRVRDEAHRFALAGHQARRGKARRSSVMEEIPGVGPRRRQRLLQHFGGLAGLRNASCEEIARVSGISTALAKDIYGYLHGD